LDLQRIQSQLVRVKNEELKAKLAEELKDLRSCAKKLYDHYKAVLDRQI
jgi:hypothetical protein